jgi:hypothetical protein
VLCRDGCAGQLLKSSYYVTQSLQVLRTPSVGVEITCRVARVLSHVGAKPETILYVNNRDPHFSSTGIIEFDVVPTSIVK